QFPGISSPVVGACWRAPLQERIHEGKPEALSSQRSTRFQNLGSFSGEASQLWAVFGVKGYCVAKLRSLNGLCCGPTFFGRTRGITAKRHPGPMGYLEISNCHTPREADLSVSR